MGYVPDDAEWYVAELVHEISVEGDARNVVHKNLVLIRAHLPEDAYEKAMILGKQGDISYDNPGGRLVTIRFRGLSELIVIHGSLTHGTELLYEERVGVPYDEIEKWIRPKEQLTVFLPTKPSNGPDYRS